MIAAITIIAAAGGALLALGTYNSKVAPEGAEPTDTVTQIRQGVSIVMAITEGFWALLEALTYGDRPRVRPARATHRPRWATSLASDEDG